MKAEGFFQRKINWYYYTGDDGREYAHNAADYLGEASGSEKFPRGATSALVCGQ